MSLVLFLITAIALTLSLIRETLKRGSDSVSFTIWKFFSYYTTLSNILVLIWFAALAFWPNHMIGKFALNANVASAIAFYIVTVGIANYLIYGWQKLSLFERLSDLFVHAVTPIISLFYWVVNVEKETLQYSFLGYWLIFPLSYASYTILHGRWSGFYPYDFTNLQELGFKKVCLTAMGLTLSLIVGGTLFILLGKTIERF